MDEELFFATHTSLRSDGITDASEITRDDTLFSRREYKNKETIQTTHSGAY
jgi:hypothetical protein